MSSRRDNAPFARFAWRDEQGFMLAEILVASALALTLLAIFYNFYRFPVHTLRRQEKGIEVLAEARAAMALMTREVREAGYWPSTGGRAPSGCARIRSATATQIRLQTDLNGNGTCSDAYEDITYRYNATTKSIERGPSGNALAMDVEIPSGSAFLTYYGQGSTAPLTLPVSDSRVIKRVRISFAVEGDDPTPEGRASGKKVRITLSSDVFFRNSE